MKSTNTGYSWLWSFQYISQIWFTNPICRSEILKIMLEKLIVHGENCVYIEVWKHKTIHYEFPWKHLFSFSFQILGRLTSVKDNMIPLKAFMAAFALLFFKGRNNTIFVEFFFSLFFLTHVTVQCLGPLSFLINPCNEHSANDSQNRCL